MYKMTVKALPTIYILKGECQVLIKVLDYESAEHHYVIPDNTARLHVTILTGDEIITLFDKDGNEFGRLDPMYNFRKTDYFDGEYDVVNDQISAWMQRKSSYDEDWLSWDEQTKNFLNSTRIKDWLEWS